MSEARERMEAAARKAVGELSSLAAWCGALDPKALIPAATGFNEDGGFWPTRGPQDVADMNAAWGRAVDTACEHRRKAVEFLKLDAKQAQGGALLGYWPDDSLSCGAAEVESLGFFDVENTPLADSWVSWFLEFSDRGVLICWVPASWLQRANNGIAVNPEACIAWLSRDAHPAIATAFAAAGWSLPSNDELAASSLEPPGA